MLVTLSPFKLPSEVRIPAVPLLVFILFNKSCAPDFPGLITGTEVGQVSLPECQTAKSDTDFSPKVRLSRFLSSSFKATIAVVINQVKNPD